MTAAREAIMAGDHTATAKIRARYERLAPVYDVMEAFAERRFSPWRSRFWSLVEGPRVLEVGVGTGKNMAYYPGGAEITAIELAPAMLRRAENRAMKLGLFLSLGLGDVQELDFEDASFDDVVATFVFCSVPDPVLGLRELMRVVKPGGRLLLLEHVRSATPMIGALMDLLNLAVSRVMGANINRNTVSNVEESGWQLDEVHGLGAGGIFKLIAAHRR